MHALLLNALLLFAAPIQSPPQGTVPLGGTVFNPVFKRMCVADLDQSGQPDVVFVRDNKFEIIGDPATFGWYAGELGPVKDLALLPGGGLNAEDRIVTVGGNGVEEWSGFRCPDANSVFDPVATSLDGLPLQSEWLNAKKVATDVFSGESRPRIVGAMSNLRSVRTLQCLDDSDDLYSDHELSFSPAIDEDILDLAWVNYFNDSTPELTILTTTKMRIYSVPISLNSSGPTATTHVITLSAPTGWTEECMTVGSYPAGHLYESREWVAAVVNHSNGTQQYLSIIDFAGAHSSVLLQDTPNGATDPVRPDVVAMDAGDYDGNGTMDLLLSNNASDSLWILQDTYTGSSGAPVFVADLDDPTKLFSLDTGSTVSGLQNTLSTPAFADLDNDGDLDVLTTVRATASLFMSWNQEVVESKWVPVLKPGLDANDVARPWLMREGNALTLGALVEVPEGAPAVNDLFLQVAVFSKAAPPTSTITERVGHQVALIDWDTISSEELVAVDCALHSPAYSYSAPYAHPYDEVKFENLYIVMVRYVALVNGTIRYTYPASFYGLEASTANGNLDYILGLTEASPVLVGYQPCPSCSTGDELSTMTVMPTMPTPAQGTTVQ